MPNSQSAVHASLLTRRSCLALLPGLATFIAHAQAPEPATVRIGVLSLFRPRTLVLTAPQQVTVRVDGTPRVLDPRETATIHAAGSGILVDGASCQTVSLPQSEFTLIVPGKLTRGYRGALTVTARNGILIPVVAMDPEVAVASIVAAESPAHAPLEALKAQAVVSRSYLLANPRTHPGYDACDTTHCQFLRSPPAASSPAAIATWGTRRTVVTWTPSPGAAPRIVPAMYSRSCGGQTRVPNPAPDDHAYPFYSVPCAYCRRHPEAWSRTTAGAPPLTERERIGYNRTHGWGAIPSNTHTATGTVLEGRGMGHGIGLCQLGSVDLAHCGETFSEIIRHYFPNTSSPTLP
jgi:stage II sporulation protein D